MGAVRVEERVLAAFGHLIEAPTRFEPGRDVKQAGVLWALPALLANGTARHHFDAATAGVVERADKGSVLVCQRTNGQAALELFTQTLTAHQQ